MNIFTFTGNLGRDCEVKATQSGQTVGSFSVAVKSGFGQNEKTTWVNCVMFGKKAEGQLPQYLTKGTQVAISGELTLEEWQKDGVTNKALKVVVNNIDLIGGNQQQNAPQQQAQPQAAPQQQWGQQAPQQNQQPAPPNPQQANGGAGYNPPQQQQAPQQYTGQDVPF